MNRIKLWWKTQALRQDTRSEWMKGLLWAESNFKHNPDLDVGKIVRKFLYEQCDPFEDKDSIGGAEDYLKKL